MAIHKFPFSVAYADTDACGITYHGRYLEIAERARLNWLEDKNVPTGDNFIIKSLHIEYNVPLLLKQKFYVETEITSVGRCKLDMVQRFVSQQNDKDVIHAVLTSRAAYVGAGPHYRLKQMPEELRAQMMLCNGKQK